MKRILQNNRLFISVFFPEREWLKARVHPCTTGMRLADFHYFLISNGPESLRGELSMEHALQLAKSVPAAVSDVDNDNLYPWVLLMF